MSYLPPQPVKSRKLRERYKQHRRRQLIHIVLAVIILMALATVVLLVILGVRACSSTIGRRWEVQSSVHRGMDSEYASLASRIRLKSAPLDWTASTNGFVILGQDPGGRLVTGSYLAAYSYETAGLLWEQQLANPYRKLTSVGQYVVATRVLDLEQLGINLTGISDSTGNIFWDQQLEGLTAPPSITAGTSYFAVGFTRDDTYRLVIFDPQSGGKLHTPRLSTTGLRHVQVDPALDNLFLASWDDYFGFYYQNVSGVISGQDGKTILSHRADSYIADGLFDPASQAGFIVSQSQTSAELTHISADGSARRCTSFGFTTHKLASGDGQLLLAYEEPDADGTSAAIKLSAYEIRSGLGTQGWDLPGGHLVGLDYIAGDPGWFVIAVSETADEDALPSGAGLVYILNAGWEEPVLVDGLKSAPQGVLAFKQDCVVLERGGRILSLVAAGPFFKRLAQAKHSVLRGQLSSDGQHLVVSAQPELDELDGPETPMEFICFE